MIKYVNYEIVFAEIPNEVTLAINISNCPNSCKNCHSSYLTMDIGRELNKDVLKNICRENAGITCVCFMGGDRNPEVINKLAKFVKDVIHLKVGWYSGMKKLTDKIDLENFDFVKLGPYKEEYGPLNNPNTNQRFYKVVDNQLDECTNLFWKNECNSPDSDNN